MSEALDLNASDCIVLEEHISVVDLDTTEEEISDKAANTEAEKEKPFVQLIFQDAGACRALLDRIRRCVEVYLKTQDKTVRVVTDESGEKAEIFADGKDDGTIFMVDKNPSTRLKTIEVPAYQSSERTLHNGELPEVRQRLRKVPMCYNCGDGHALNDCTLPRNPERIRKARMQMQSNKLERYHMDIEQKFAHLKPGCCSENLKKALGVGRKHLPGFIYRMRLLGYPPGWLEEAKVSHSGLNLFDSEGRSVRHEDVEDGEVDEMRAKYNPEKIIDFPGFNVDPPLGYVDESQFHGVPAMMDYHRKEVMFRMFGLEESQPGYKKKRLGELEASNGDTPPPVALDMDIEEDSEPSPPGVNDESSQDSRGVREEPEGDSQEAQLSPSLDELQAAQERLLEALSANSPGNPSSPATMERPKTPDNRGKSLSTLPGTPILVPFSPYSHLPDGDRWAKGVSGVIDFENLPDSTGKYEKMKNVLEKVREKVCKIHKD
ncbi:zinc finger CCHC domain-containing protein 8 homolog [Lutzomyia longipalpis]|uniref:zinc finger CCHC domain-containing protein 8 homolog n=1 Tax=Lutzomyia longipalpis TaxID=7200 RepID=UPI002483949E|nr:zinc finger CCHC domain-containing protein 8 homolog [Lutzomyia longipalpis]